MKSFRKYAVCIFTIIVLVVSVLNLNLIRAEEEETPTEEIFEQEETVSEAETDDVSPTDGTAFAVLTEEGDLIFFRSFEDYENGSNKTVKDIYGNQYTGVVYSGIETSIFYFETDVPWYSKREDIKKSYVASNQTIQPKATNNLFSGCSNMTSFNPAGFDTTNDATMYGMFNAVCCISPRPVRTVSLVLVVIDEPPPGADGNRFESTPWTGRDPRSIRKEQVYFM